MNQTPIQRAQAINRAMYDDERIASLGEVGFKTPPETTEKQIIRCIPNEGEHKDVEYVITLTWGCECEWPHVGIDSSKYDPRKTPQMRQNKGHGGSEHKGICFKGMTHGYAFKKNFKKKFGNNWGNYIYQLILQFNNPQSWEGARGIKDPEY
jgi:hypothetical protein